MSFKRLAKQTMLRLATLTGLNDLVLSSSWRTQRLLILCWHKIALEDEHLWNPELCLSESTFVARMELIRTSGCTVLALQDALTKLQQGTLPRRAVVLTVDDGDSSVYLKAWPILRRFGFPATLYWSTYYSTRPYAVFDPMVRYLLWKGRGIPLNMEELNIAMSLESPELRRQVFDHIYRFSRAQDWTASTKEGFLERLAFSLKIDFRRIKQQRILHLISESEAREMIADGLDVQLHTHRHRVPLDRLAFQAELSDNAQILRAAGAIPPSHFCYPSGSFAPQFGEWLKAFGIVSATSCQPGLVSKKSDAYYLPRFLDSDRISTAEFSSWLSGVAALLSGHQRMDTHGFRQ